MLAWFVKRLLLFRWLEFPLVENLIIELGGGKFFLPKPDVFKSQLSLKSKFILLFNNVQKFCTVVLLVR